METQADRIRTFVERHYFLPARTEGREFVEVRAGDVHSAMGLSNAMPAVCSALRSSKIEARLGVSIVSVTGPRAGANVYFRFSVLAAMPEGGSQRTEQLIPGPSEPRGHDEFYDPEGTIVLVSCVAKKSRYPEPVRSLYRSEWFLKARSFVEARGLRWYVLSALHGVLHPDEVVAPYDHTLRGARIAERQAWAASVLQRLLPLLSGRRHVVVLAGHRYREFLVPALMQAGLVVEVPMAGMRIGEQLAWLKEAR